MTVLKLCGVGVARVGSRASHVTASSLSSSRPWRSSMFDIFHSTVLQDCWENQMPP